MFGAPAIGRSSPAHRTQENAVPFSLLPREEKFFDLFVEVAHRSHQAAGHLVGLFSEPAKAAYHAEQIKRLEHECDQFTHEVVNRLDRTFITPIDREDIYQLAGDLDDVSGHDCAPPCRSCVDNARGATLAFERNGDDRRSRPRREPDAPKRDAAVGSGDRRADTER